MQNYSPFAANLWRKASNFPVVLLLKHYHNRLFSLKEKKGIAFFFFFTQPVWCFWKGSTIRDSYRGRERLTKLKESQSLWSMYVCRLWECVSENVHAYLSCGSAALMHRVTQQKDHRLCISFSRRQVYVRTCLTDFSCINNLLNWACGLTFYWLKTIERPPQRLIYIFFSNLGYFLSPQCREERSENSSVESN